MYGLYLNSVYSNAENYTMVAYSYSIEKLQQLLKDEKLETPYRDSSGYYRVFKEGLLHNYNPPMMNGTNMFGSLEGVVKINTLSEIITQITTDYNFWLSQSKEIF